MVLKAVMKDSQYSPWMGTDIGSITHEVSIIHDNYSMLIIIYFITARCMVAVVSSSFRSSCRNNAADWWFKERCQRPRSKDENVCRQQHLPMNCILIRGHMCYGSLSETDHSLFIGNLLNDYVDSSIIFLTAIWRIRRGMDAIYYVIIVIYIVDSCSDRWMGLVRSGFLLNRLSLHRYRQVAVLYVSDDPSTARHDLPCREGKADADRRRLKVPIQKGHRTRKIRI